MALKTHSITRLKRSLAQQEELGTDDRMDVVHDEIVEVTTVDGFVEQITSVWDDCQELINRAQEAASRRFLTIGRYLAMASKKLARGEYESVLLARLPFGRKVAFQLQTVAKAVEDKRLSVHELPRSYATGYQLTTLSDEELAEARRRGLVRPDILRREIEVFKKEVRRPQIPERRTELRERRKRILDQMARLSAELAEVDAELGIEVIDGETIEVTDEGSMIDVTQA
jgi:hypothetical protein